MKKILHGLDGSENSFKALREGIILAQLYGAELHTISVEELPRFSETISEVEEEKLAAESRFHEYIKKARELAKPHRVVIRSHILVGHEVKSIIEFINENNFDLLIIGFMGNSAIYDRMMGSTCQSLVRMAPCSILVIK